MTTDWAALSHAYGGAEDVADMLAALREGDAEQGAHDLWATVLHQGSLYDASAPAVAEICIVLGSRSKARVELAAWLLASAVAAALAHGPDDPHAAAVLAAAEPAWTWARKAIGKQRTAEIAAEVLMVRADRAAEALDLLTEAAGRWPDRPVFLKAIHALDPSWPVLTRALDDPDPDLAATAAIMLINTLGGPPDDALGSRLIDTTLRVLAHRALDTDLPDTPVKLIMTALTGVDPQFTEPEYPHPPTVPGPAARLVGALLDSEHEPTAVETAVALTQRNIARSRGVADWAAALITSRLRTSGPVADALMLAAFHLGPRLTVEQLSSIEWAEGSVAGGTAAAILVQLDPSLHARLSEWLGRGWGHPSLARLEQPLTDDLADAIAARLRALGVPGPMPHSFDKPWHENALEMATHALHNNEFIAWHGVLARGGRHANEQLAELRAGWPHNTAGMTPTLQVEHLRALGEDVRPFLIERVRLGHNHGLDVACLPADPEVVEAARAMLTELAPDSYVDSSLIELAGWVAEHSTWDPSALFATAASKPWPAIAMLGLRTEQAALALPTVVAALHTNGQTLAAAPILRPDELSAEDVALRADVLCRMVTRLPDRCEQACAVLAAEPETVAAIADRLRAWRDGDELFDALYTNESAGFTDVAVKARIASLL